MCVIGGGGVAIFFAELHAYARHHTLNLTKYISIVFVTTLILEIMKIFRFRRLSPERLDTL